MATKARLYQVEVCDGHGCKREVIAAPSKDDVQNILKETLTPHQRPQNLKFLGWSTVQSRPNDEDTGAEFVAERGGERFLFEPGHPSHAYLVKQFPRQVAEINEFLEEQRGDEL